ncbi:MAG: hypothetical protein JWN01_635 [Patescibacteria group bacterium]|nr:hypothetical protein [Patescibacteria group bacterium]
MSQRGFIRLPILIAIVLGLGFGASGYLNYSQHQRAEQDKKLLQGQITDLRYQLKQDQQAVGSPSPSPSGSVEPAPTPSPSPSPAVAGTASVAISQFGVRLTATDPLLDLTYAPIQSAGLTVAGFTTESLLAKYPSCKPGALGALVRRPQSQKAPSWNKLVKTLGSYSYYYSAASASDCTNDQAGHNTYAAAKAALANGVLPTLSN